MIMSKLQSDDINDYLDKHVPYRVGILLAHFRLVRQGRASSQAILDACFVASLVTARMFLNTLGIGKDKTTLVRFRPLDTDVCVDDLGGVLIDPAILPPDEQDLFFKFLKMADQAAAHFTIPIVHDWTVTHDVVLRVHKHLKANLYDHVGRRIEDV